jgi:hypothetical protein
VFALAALTGIEISFAVAELDRNGLTTQSLGMTGAGKFKCRATAGIRHDRHGFLRSGRSLVLAPLT